MRLEPPSARLAVAGGLGLALALAALALLGGGAWRAWLGAAALWSSAPAGAVGLLLIMRFLPGGWVDELGPPLEAIAMFAPLAGLLLTPIVLGLDDLYPWARAAGGEGFRGMYLSAPLFVLRSLAWFALLTWVAWRPPATLSPVAASFALIAFPILGTWIAVDWLLSLDPEFASSGFGLYVLCLQVLSALALAIICVVRAGRVARLGLLGALLLTLLLLWAYFAFMPFFITWSDDLPAGVAWYQARGEGIWGIVAWGFTATRLGPAGLLLFGPVRRAPRTLVVLSSLVLAGSVLEIAWLALPGARPGPGALDVGVFGLAVAAVGALALALAPFVRRRREARSA